MIDIGILIESKSFNNKWPRIKIYFNNELIDTLVCKSSASLHYQVQTTEHNILAVELFDKNFGDDNQWDIDSNGQGLEAKINDIKLNDVSIENLLSSAKFQTNWTPAQLGYLTKDFLDQYSEYFSNGMMSFNGRLTFEFSTPVYDFLIEKKYKVPYDPGIAFYSNKTELFHYESGLATVKEIKKIISKHNA